jgi:uncharacterized protein (DUF934 family)
MPLLDQTGALIDPWAPIDGAALANVSHALVELETLPAAIAIKSGSQKLGVLVPNTVDVAALAQHFAALDLIAIAFPSYGDGRGFSVARRIRALGYKGRLRARGPLIVDQFRYAVACSFDEIELPEPSFARQPITQWLAQIAAEVLPYQRGYARGESILDARRAARNALREGNANV